MAKALVYKATADDHKDPTGFVLKELASMCTTITDILQSIGVLILFFA
jgi:hypothetical protein